MSSILLIIQTNPYKMCAETTQKWKFQETQIIGVILLLAAIAREPNKHFVLKKILSEVNQLTNYLK